MSLLTVETVSSACSAAYNIAKSMSPLGVSHGQTSSASQQVETEGAGMRQVIDSRL